MMVGSVSLVFPAVFCAELLQNSFGGALCDYEYLPHPWMTAFTLLKRQSSLPVNGYLVVCIQLFQQFQRGQR
jgi:hypothetical protein